MNEFSPSSLLTFETSTLTIKLLNNVPIPHPSICQFEFPFEDQLDIFGENTDWSWVNINIYVYIYIYMFICLLYLDIKYYLDCKLCNSNGN